MRRLIPSIACAVVALTLVVFAQGRGPASSTLSTSIDALAAAIYKPDAPGAAVIVVRDGRVVHRKGYGMADLELGVAMRPEFVFRLGSVTKQFTSACILMLEEQGKLSVGDPMTKYLPDYPTRDRTITVEHLLTHTSGIKSYTNMPSWLPLIAKDFTVSELVDFFKNEPMEFEPGERWAYNNSGYFLLGAIIEKVSGMKYVDFVQRNIFDPVGMKHSYYGDHARVIPLRIPGYAAQGATFVNAQYLSMTQPYAAGALLSNVDDLALWDAAISQGKLLRPHSWERAFADYRLKSGKTTGYGYGWSLTTYEGHAVQEHGGGIPGFSTFVVRVPDAHVYVAVLSNNVGSNPGTLARKIAALAIGKPITPPTAVTVDPAVLARYAGRYEGDSGERLMLTVQAGQLMLQGDGPAARLMASSETELFQPDGLSRLTVQKDAAGEVTGLVVTGWSPPRTLKRVQQKPQSERKTVAVDPKIYDLYAGEYALAPGFILTITREGDHLMTQATGQSKVEVFAASETTFFLKVTEAQITFVKDAGGKVTGLVLDQGGRQMKAPKVK
jgi:D-alanyl-D-alanine carboxypeptidase